MANDKNDIRLGKPVGNRERGTNTRIGTTTVSRKLGSKEKVSVGMYTTLNAKGEISDDVQFRARMRSLQNAARGMVGGIKTAALFSDGGLGTLADIADSQNIGYNSFEFPVDALEGPQSRAEELRYYRMAYDRDPIVGRAIDMHTELPLSNMVLEKPKCSSQELADYVYDFFEGLKNRTNMFQVVISAVREYWTVGEAFIFVEELEDVEPCPEAQKYLDKNKDTQSTDPGRESQNAPMGGSSNQILDFLQPEKRSSWKKKRASVLYELKQAGIPFNFDEDPDKLDEEIWNRSARIAKVAKTIGRNGAEDNYPISITAAPGDPPPADAGAVPPAGADAAPEGVDAPVSGEGAPLGAEGLGDVAGIGGEGDLSGGTGMPPMGGGGGGGGMGLSTPPGSAGGVQDAIAMGSSISAQRELMEMRHYLKLLEKKKSLLEELKEMREKKKEEMELFSHITNKDYEGFDHIKVLPPEQIELSSDDGGMADGPSVYYKPPAKQKESYLNNPNVSSEVKDKLQQEGKIPLNQDPFSGSYVIHFSRAKSGYELHGRSILQRCMRTIMYREKLRQVQNTIASRNMTPKTLVVAPDISPAEAMNLRAQIDEVKNSPDGSIVATYEMRWEEIGSEGRLLALDGEWTHTNSDLAIGLSLSPELLIGEGMFSGNRIQMQLMETSYLQFRDVLTGIIEDKIFKPIAMKKGFYEMDKYGRPRWIYPKVSFSRMALRDQGDVYDMLFNLYSKGSLPVEIIYEFLNLDPEDCTRKLEEALFTPMDSKFNEMLSTIYNSVGDWLMTNTDLGKRITAGLTLNEVDASIEDDGLEGSGEGVN
jgi:hypothetical protein